MSADASVVKAPLGLHQLRQETFAISYTTLHLRQYYYDMESQSDYSNPTRDMRSDLRSEDVKHAAGQDTTRSAS
jgi:hypothetical protein